jgi:hypothetical protein
MSDHEHSYPDTDITEGNAPIPLWFKALAIVLLVFLVVFYSNYLIGAQPSTAQMR